MKWVCLFFIIFLAACASPSETPVPGVVSVPTFAATASTGRPALAPPQKASQVDLKINVMETVWAKIEADGKILHEGMFNQGQETVFRGQVVRVRASNGAALLLTPNGLPSEFLGRLGKPSEKHFRLQDGKIYVDSIDPPQL